MFMDKAADIVHVPKISVIIPTCNRAHLIDGAIKSVLDQTFQDFELIVVDDGSKDNTEEIIKRFQQEDSRIRYIRHDLNKGGNAARNTGLRNAKGEYVAFLDSDDSWLPTKLEKQLFVFEHSHDPKLGFVYCGASYFGDQGEHLKEQVARQEGAVFLKVLGANFVPGGGSSNLIKKGVFEICGVFDEAEELRWGGSQEYEMWLRIAQHYSFGYVDEILVRCWRHTGSITGRSDTISKERSSKYIFKKYEVFYAEHPEIYSIKLRHYGINYLLRGEIQKSRTSFFESVKHDPLNIKNYCYLFVSFFGHEAYRERKIFKIYKKYVDK
jgi:glycosyltransferase involved in cell wall biosynthesis